MLTASRYFVCLHFYNVTVTRSSLRFIYEIVCFVNVVE